MRLWQTQYVFFIKISDKANVKLDYSFSSTKNQRKKCLVLELKNFNNKIFDNKIYNK